MRLLSGGDIYPLFGFRNGGIYEITGTTSDTFNDDSRKRIRIRNNSNCTGYALPENLELFESRLTKKQRIEELEKKVESLTECLENQDLQLKKNERDYDLALKMIKDLSNEIDKLKEINHRPHKTLLLEDKTDLQNKDIIEFEGEKYQKVNRRACECDVVIFRKNDTALECSIINKPYYVESNELGYPVFMGDNGIMYNVYAKYHNRTTETVDVYELIEEEKLENTNKLRAEIVEKAKRFVDERTTKEGEVIIEDNELFGILTAPHYDIKENKREVTVVLKGTYTGTIRAKGKAKCSTNDVFNEHIGKAIALGRALNEDVSEFEKAAQPTDLVVGMEFSTKGLGNKKVVATVSEFTPAGNECLLNSRMATTLMYKIVNDTNAKY